MTGITTPVRAHMTSLVPAWIEWQSRLPAVLERVTTQWGLEVEELFTRRVASSLYRVRVRGREAVLKLARPSDELCRQADVLEAARGRGYVHLYDRDDEHGALLLEALGQSMESRSDELYKALPASLVLPLMRDTELIVPVVSALQEAWQLPLSVAPEPDESTHRAAQLRDSINRSAEALDIRWRYGDAIESALVMTEHRLAARSASTMVLCHGDAHIGNLLAVTSPRPGAPEGYVFIDPDGIRCEAEYDLGVVLRGFNRMVLAAEDPVVEVRAWCAILAAATGLDAEVVWQWAFIERVASGLYLIQQGWPERGFGFLDAASWLIARKND